MSGDVQAYDWPMIVQATSLLITVEPEERQHRGCRTDVKMWTTGQDQEVVSYIRKGSRGMINPLLICFASSRPRPQTSPPISSDFATGLLPSVSV